MFRFTSLLAIVFFSVTAFAQSPVLVSLAQATESTVTPAPVLADRMVPQFPLSAGSFTDFLANNLTYPELALDYAVEGTVVLEVVVATTGKVTVSQVAKSLFAPLDEAAIAAVEKLPRFLPAVRNGKAIDQKMMIPFKFSLQ